MPLVQPESSGLIKTSPTAQNPVPVPQIHITDPKFSDVSVDTRWTPVSTLMQYVTGYSWTVDYYSQVIDSDTPLGGQRPTSSSVHQQYRLIKDLVMQVSEPLRQGQNPDTKAMSYVGKAVVHSFIPNDGDMFIADIGDGQRATFRITLTEKKAIFKEAIYEIEYEVGTTEQEFIDDLTNKTVETLVYRAEMVTYGESPIILTNRDAQLDEAANLVQAVLGQYFTRFFSADYRTLVVPGQVYSVYDPYLVSFMLKMLNSDDCQEITQMKQLNVQDDGVYQQNNLWEAVARQDEMFLNSAFTRAGLAETSAFQINPFFAGIRYTGVRFVVYPKDPVLGIFDVSADNVKTISDTMLAPSATGSYPNFQDPNTGALPQNAGVPNLYTVTFDDRYVLSQNFYGQTSTQSTLEQMVRAHLKRQAINLDALMTLARSFNQWGLVEQFYYIPLILALIRGGRFAQ